MQKVGLQNVRVLLILVALSLLAVPFAWAQQSSTGSTPSQAEIDKIIATFTSKEVQFRRALTQYSFKRDAIIQSLGMGGQVVGEYHRVSNFTFDDQGARYEKITFFPMPSYARVSKEDLDDLGGINPFALEPDKIDRYNIRYAGKEKIDELNLYVFDVTPKVVPDPKKSKERLFTGRVWVDDQEFQIVKTKGKGVPETKHNKFPVVETYREQFGGLYWFPTYSYADEEIIFDSGDVLHVRMQVRYTDFAPARVDVKVRDVETGGELQNTAKPTPTPTPKP